jgi:phosphoesterase RecJ-like protein
MIAKQIAAFMQANNNYLLSCHINADGDAISATLAVAQALDQLGKTYRVILHDELPDQRFTYLKHFEKIEWIGDVHNFQPTAAIVCDTPTRERMGDVANIIPASEKMVKIDHHPDEDQFADLHWVDLNSSSTTCLVYQILEELPIQYDVDLAQTMLSGLMYDTGRFSYRNTKAIDFLIASKMVEYGANVELSYKKIFGENTASALQTIGKGLSDLQTYFNGQVGIIYLDHEETNRNPSGEIEELANYTTQVRGTHVGFFVRQPKIGLFKISLRSRGDVNVNAVARAFGGGGHEKASGCRIEAENFEAVRSQLLAEVEKHL